eukprot:SAG11_NODE_3985_length_2120_cov_3.557150_1_plen_226_part_00
MATTIDWCEENFAVTPMVAEFFNTATSVACIVPPLFWFLLPTPDQAGTIPLMHCLMSFIMFGSAAFHGTMTWGGQLLDELPILLFCGFSFSILLDTYSLQPAAAVEKNGGNRRAEVIIKRAAWAPGPRLLAVVVAVEVALLAYVYVVHQKIYATFLVVVLVQALAHWPLLILGLQRRFDWDATIVRLMGMHVALGYSGYGLWCIENTFCEQLRWMNLHALCVNST